MKIQAFPKVLEIGSPYIEKLTNGTTFVTVTEKLDGSQFSFGVFDDELVFRSKRTELFSEIAGDFKPIIDYLTSIKNRIPNQIPRGVAFSGEYFRKPHQNSIKYDRIPKNHLVLYSAHQLQTNAFLNLDEPCRRMGLEQVPILFQGIIQHPNELVGYLDQESVLGGAKVEGVVIKAYEPYMIGDRIIPLMSGKVVSPEFQEVNRKRWASEESGKSKIEEFIAAFKTDARWAKAVQHLRDSGSLEGTVRDIGALMKEVQDDVLEEEEAAAKEWLWQHFKGRIARTSSKGFPEWYKKQLGIDTAGG